MREQTTSTEENTVQAKNKGNWIERAVSQHFTVLLTVLALIGGATAMFLPLVLSSAGQVDSNLRLHILYMTGGIIAVLGLVETHRKNTVDREKAEVEKENYEKMQAHQASVLDEQQRQFNVTMDQEREKIEADKAKNEQDHIRQVHAERRIRYTTAIEQLSNDKASIRLGGVYTLVGLVDEWLADDKTIPNIEERRKESQVIINNLCAYIRSPFLLAERAKQLDAPYAKDLQKNFGGDIEKFNEDKQYFAQEKAALEEERQVRQSIIKEIREHLSKNYSESSSWSDFDYDFSHAHFFYPVNFNNSYFGTSIVNFSGATFTQDANFSRATFTQDANFIGAAFTQDANFSGATFTQDANFSGATFTQDANFIGAAFTQDANFSRATFTQDASFIGAAFTQDASFIGAAFTQANFSRATFTKGAYFFEATFTKGAYFFEATFTERADFSGAIFHSEPSFTNVLLGKARFSHKIAPESYSFGVDPDSPCKIEIEEQEHNGTKFIIPKGTILFDPDEPSEQEDNNSNDS